MKIWLFNPFKYIAGAKALVIGWVFMLVTACIAAFSLTHFDGVIDAHYGLLTPFGWYVADQLAAWLPAVLVFYLAGLFFSRSAVRPIDIAGTLALARWPYIFIAVINLFLPPYVPKDIHHIGPGLILNSLVTIPATVWMIVLLYRAFSTSTNLKGSRGTVIFILALVLAEVLSKFVFYKLYQSFT